MKFENPSILYFLILLIIPIIVHLFNLRKHKKVFFSNVLFLKNIKNKSKKKRKIRNWLILLSRLMLVTTIVLAFTKPSINNKKIPITDSISIYIDNSLSMDIINPETSKNLIEEAKEIALSIINSLDESQKINIITNSFSYNNQKFYNKEKVIEIVKSIEPSPFNSSICSIIEKQKNISKEKKILHKFILSDYDFNFISNSNCNLDTIDQLNIIKVSDLINSNISINNCGFEHSFHQKNEKGKLIIEFENHGETDLELAQFKLYINEKQRGVYNISLPKHSIIKKEIDIINSEDGNIKGRIELFVNDNYKYDNTFFFSYSINKKINILCIYEDSPSIELVSVFSDPLFNLTKYSKSQIKIAELKNYDLIIFDHLNGLPSGLNFNTNKILEKGKNILIIPSKDINKDSYNRFLNYYEIDNILEWTVSDTKTDFINLNHWIFTNVFKEVNKNINLPKIQSYYKTEKNNLTKNRENILNIINNDLFFTEYKRKNGSIFFCSSPLNYNNFSNHALFLPIMHNISRNKNTKYLFDIIKKNLEVEIDNSISDGNIPLIKFYKNNKEEISFFPDLKRIKNTNYLKLNNEIKESGNYTIFQKNNNDVFLESFLSLNYDRNEGKVKKDENYSKNLAKLGLNLNTFDKNKTLGKETIDLSIFLIYASIFLFLIELLLLKFWRQ